MKPRVIGSQTYPQADYLIEVAAAEALPAVVSNPFDSTRTIDLTDTPMPSFNLVDGSVSMAVAPDMPFVLFKGFNADTWFFAPRWGRITKNPEGEPAFTVTKKIRNNPDGSRTTLGGILSFMIELVVELPGESQREKWTELIQTLYNLSPGAGVFNFQPLRTSMGKMNVYGLDRFIVPGQRLKDIEVGASSSIGFAFDLNADGADHFAALMERNEPIAPQVAIMFDYSYESLIPTCLIKATGKKKKCYDYFSINQKARASYFGLVEGSEEVSHTRVALKEEHALQVAMVGKTPPGIDESKLLDSVFDRFVKTNVGEWITPSVTPVETPDPEGFYGGVTVNMKHVELSDTAEFNETIEFGSIEKNLHQVSFNFEQQVSGFDPAKHLVVEQDDIKLPFTLSIGSCDKVHSIVPSASYTTTADGPRTVECPAVTATGGLTRGYIQFTYPQRPTSAQVQLSVTFDQFGPGYIYSETLPVSETGASFLFEPDIFIQRTTVYFIMESIKTSDRALFSWEWEPADGVANRQKISGSSMVTPDPKANSYNLPTCSIEFPFHPGDWRGSKETPRIRYSLQGLAGGWKGETGSGYIQIGDTSLVCDWEGVKSTGEVLYIPEILTRDDIGEPFPGGRGGVSGPGSGPHAGLLGDEPSVPLGYVPGPGEPTLLQRERIAMAALRSETAKISARRGSYDLRQVGDLLQNFITPVKDQGHCGSCVAFGVCAAVEGTLQVRRNDPHLAPDFSEAHLFYCLGAVNHGRSCGNMVGNPPAHEPHGGWFPQGALEEFQKTGVADEQCFPYASPALPTSPTLPCEPCTDWSGRATRISGWTVLQDAETMKEWISDGSGPLVAVYNVYEDFLRYFSNNHDPQAVYRSGTTPGKLYGGHCVCAVGYSDEGRYWICKNSWGSGWADGGFFKIGYGQAGIDAYMWGVNID